MVQDQAQGNVKTSYGLIDRRVGYYLDEKNQMTEEFKNEMRIKSAEEIYKLESTIRNARPPMKDYFGIKRRFCTICENDCPGYTGSSLPFSANSQSAIEFPTFCKVCSCPAHFHTKEEV